MKKNIFRILSVFVVISILVGALSSCEELSFKEDTDYAFVEITTADGESLVEKAYHGFNYYWDSDRQEHAMNTPVIVNGAPGNVASIHFHCNQCGYDEVIDEAIAPYARLFYCQCSGGMSDNDRKEYISVQFGVKADSLSNTPEKGAS